MKASLPAPAFSVDRQSPVPLFRQICNRTRAAIAGGRLRPGERLPSARSLAAQLGAARGTVEAAYAILAGEGWIVARGAAGTMVAPQLNQQPKTQASMPVARPEPTATLHTDPTPRPFRMGFGV